MKIMSFSELSIRLKIKSIIYDCRTTTIKGLYLLFVLFVLILKKERIMQQPQQQKL